MPSKINTKKFNNQQRAEKTTNVQLEIWQHLYDNIKLVHKIDSNVLINKHRRFIGKKTASGYNLNIAKLKSLVLLKELCHTKTNYELKKDSVIRTIEDRISKFSNQQL